MCPNKGYIIVMRLWSLHPQYLDAKGLVALWREGLLAQKVLQGQTKGYRNHPQLNRFKQTPDPLSHIAYYLSIVQQQATERGYQFNASKIADFTDYSPITVTTGQMQYEVQHLHNKLKQRDANKYAQLKNLEYYEPHPLFRMVEGDIEAWEIVT